MKNAKIENTTFLLERNRIKIRVKIVIFFFRDSIRHFSWVLSDLYLLAELIYDAAAAASEHQAMNCHFQSLFSGQSCLMECHDRSGAEATFPPQDPRATPN